MRSTTARLAGMGFAAGVLFGACGGGGSSSGAAPGHGSPQAVLAGVIQSLQKSRSVVSICQWYVPSEQSRCRSTLGHLPVGLDNGREIPTNSQRATIQGARVGNVAISPTDTEAIAVIVADKFCVVSPCLSNHDPNAGLPRGSETFAQAWNRVQGNSSSTNPTLPLTKVKGKWYLGG